MADWKGPRKFYKYRPLHRAGPTGPSPEPFTESIFSRREIFYATPNQFNDPFDCSLRLHADNSTDAEWIAYLDDLGRKDPAYKPKIAAIKAGRTYRTYFQGGVGLKTQQEHYEESSVFCLSNKGNSTPMFSYYADSHRGIALEFTFEVSTLPCGFPFRDPADPYNPYQSKIVCANVEYSTSLPELNYHRLRGTDQLVKSLLFTKHDDWSHEDEFRIFRRKVPAGAVPFEPACLTGVVLGCKTTPDDEQLIRDWLANWPTDVVLSRAEIVPSKYELEVKVIEVLCLKPVSLP